MNKISIIGMGYVGSAMATLIASIKKKNRHIFFVNGIEKSSERGKIICESINSGKLPFNIGDKDFKKKFYYSTKIKRNLVCATQIESIKDSKIVIVSINCDLSLKKETDVNLKDFLKSIEKVAYNLNENALLIVESTIPPGTCEKKIYPILKRVFKKRNISEKKILLSYTYERVMPGVNYLNSIKNYWRVVSGLNKPSLKKCVIFLKKIINTKKYPLTILDNIRSCELGKILENSYRATNIAFIEEWSRFAEQTKIDIYKVIEAIRLRPTHSNIRHPGFGVGGYCLTKDPYFGEYSAKKIWKKYNLDFPFTKKAIEINKTMPLVSLEKISNIYNKRLKNKKILIMGMSYKEDVGDLRSSPSLYFIKNCLNRGMLVSWHDPYIKDFEVKNTLKLKKLKMPSQFDVILFAVKHKKYSKIIFNKPLFKNTTIFDANYVLTKRQLDQIKRNKIKFGSIGRS